VHLLIFEITFSRILDRLGTQPSATWNGLTLFAGAAATQTNVTDLGYLVFKVSGNFQKALLENLFIAIDSLSKIVGSNNVHQ